MITKGIKITSLSLILLLGMTACNKDSSQTDDNQQTTSNRENIVISFTNDDHCGIEENLGYAKIKAYADEMRENNEYFTLCNTGDFIQGSTIGTVTQGEAIIDIMNEISYDIVTLGNHEFDYGINRLNELMKKSEFSYVNSNITYTGTKQTSILDNISEYIIKDFGGVKVGFVGVTTPDTISSSTPSNFKENGEYVYHFGNEGDSKKYYESVQNTVDKIKDSTDYIVLLAHLGYWEDGNTFSASLNLIQNTTDIDIVLDGHTHESYEKHIKNKDDKDVILCQTGTKLENIGQVTITKEGNIETKLVSAADRKSESMENYISKINESFAEELNKVVFKSEYNLPMTDDDGIRMVRNRETAIGDMISDAYRIIMEADIGYINGGGVRSGITAGDITIGDLIAINPFGNMLCVVEVSGQEVLDMLEYFYSVVQYEYRNETSAIGEDGSFGQISGLKLEVDTSISSPCILDENYSLLRIEGQRRVSNVKILKNNEYVDLDVNETYRLASTNYMIKKGGNGMEFLLSNNNIVVDEAKLDYQAIIEYVTNVLNNDLSQYSTVDDRIIIK